MSTDSAYEQQIVEADIVWTKNQPIMHRARNGGYYPNSLGYYESYNIKKPKCGGCKKYCLENWSPHYTGPTCALAICTIRALLAEKNCTQGIDRWRWDFCSVDCMNRYMNLNREKVLLELIEYTR